MMLGSFKPPARDTPPFPSRAKRGVFFGGLLAKYWKPARVIGIETNKGHVIGHSEPTIHVLFFLLLFRVQRNPQ